MMELVADIIVPTFNRHQAMERFFYENSILEQLPVHIWIIDDCSTPPIKGHLPAWKNLTLIRLEENHGQAAARNAAIARGVAPVVISLDDDAWFASPVDPIAMIKDLFAKHPKAGCFMFNIATPGSSYSSLPTGTILPLHVTCGCAYRREVLQMINGFSGFLHSQAEESDLSIRIYRAGYDILFSREIQVFHNFVPLARPVSWYLKARHNTTRNDLLIVWMYYPAILVIPGIGYKWLSHLIFAVTNRIAVFRTLKGTLMAGLGFLSAISEAHRRRTPLTVRQWIRWYHLQRTYLMKNN
jgi:GT2 family glycosyltransferase